MYIFIALYTLLLLTGSIIGYVKAESVASLATGLISSFLLIFSTIAYRKRAFWGKSLLLLTVLALDGFFFLRWFKTFAFFPAGLFSLLSTILLIVIALRVRKDA